MIIGSTKEDISLEKRIALTPDAAKNIIGLGLNICIEKNYAAHLGIKDEDFKKAGGEIKNSSKEVVETCNLLIKVNCPQNDEINNLKEKNRSLSDQQIKWVEQLIKEKKVKLFFNSSFFTMVSSYTIPISSFFLIPFSR